jgi:hypothetical protein
MPPQFWGKPESKSPNFGGFRGHSRIYARGLLNRSGNAPSRLNTGPNKSGNSEKSCLTGCGNEASISMIFWVYSQSNFLKRFFNRPVAIA